MAKDNSELIDVNSDVKDRVMEVSHIQSLIYVIRGKQGNARLVTWQFCIQVETKLLIRL